MIKTQIVGSGDKTAEVSRLGALVVGPLSPNETKFNELGIVDTAFNFYKPKAGQQFIITNVFAFGDKQVSSVTNATVEVYEALAEGDTAVDKTLLKFEIGQNQFQAYNEINLLVNPDVYINAKTSDDDVHMNILGFYIPKSE